LHATALYRLPTPTMVQAKAQHTVEPVIVLGNSGKHLAYCLSHALTLTP
jgi:hypothetical protein